MSARTNSIKAASKKRLTKKQESLVKLLEEGEPPTTAVKKAGYYGTNTQQTLTSPAVSKALASIEANTQQLTSLTREDVIEGLLSAIQMAEHLEDPATMIRGWNEIARLHGFHAAEKKEVSYQGQVSHDHTGQLQVDQIPTSKLLEMSAKDNAIDISPSDFKVERGADAQETQEEPPEDFEDVEQFDPTED